MSLSPERLNDEYGRKSRQSFAHYMTPL